MTSMWILALPCAVILAYIYVGYPAVMWLHVRLWGARQVRRDASHLPTVTLVISAFNEAPVIAHKLANALALDYPLDRLDVVVVSDASDDGTDQRVVACGSSRVRLFRQPTRQGKTAGLNAVMPTIGSEIIVFSDANAIYEPDAIRKLVRNFADPAVGCVVGEARYTNDPRSSAGIGESAYWSYEIRLKRLESAAGSMVGGDGAIYAIRRTLWQPMPSTAINDFLNPLQIVDAGYRVVYDGEAVCHEEPADDVGQEMKRRVRIVSRSWAAIFLVPGVLNPFRTGLFAFSLFSHKVLRWFSALWLIGFVVGTLGWTLPWLLGHETYVLASLVTCVVLSLVLPFVRRALGLLLYFFLVQWASFVGLVRGTFGWTSAVWTPPRHEREASSAAVRLGLHPLAVLPLGILVVAAAAGAALGGLMGTLRMLFWATVALVSYTYFVYPLLLAVLLPFRSRPVRVSRYEPALALLITANDEGAVMEAKLKNALACTYPKALYQIVVASDGSVDDTNAIAAAFAPEGVRLIAFPERRGKMAAMNAAIEQVDADLIVMSDANVMLSPGALGQLASVFADPTVGAASADVVLYGERAALEWPEDLYYRYERWLQRAESALGSMVGVDGGLFAVRRSLYVAPPDDCILDDVAVPMEIARRGHRVVMVPTARATEEGFATTEEEYGRKVRIVAGAVQFLCAPASRVGVERFQLLLALFSHKILRWLSPVAAVVALGTGLLLAALSPAHLPLVLPLLAILMAGVLGRSERWRRFPPIGLSYYFCLMQMAALAGLVRGLSGRQPVTWQRFARAG